MSLRKEVGSGTMIEIAEESEAVVTTEELETMEDGRDPTFGDDGSV